MKPSQNENPLIDAGKEPQKEKEVKPIGGGEDELLKEYLLSRYHIAPQYEDSSRDVYKTSPEFAYEISTIIPTSTLMIARVMTRLHCKVAYIGSQAYWVVQELQPEI